MDSLILKTFPLDLTFTRELRVYFPPNVRWFDTWTFKTSIRVGKFDLFYRCCYFRCVNIVQFDCCSQICLFAIWTLNLAIRTPWKPTARSRTNKKFQVHHVSASLTEDTREPHPARLTTAINKPLSITVIVYTTRFSFPVKSHTLDTRETVAIPFQNPSVS